MNSREFHFLIDRGGTDVERTAKYEWKTQNVIDLIGIVGASGGDDGVRACRLGELRRDLGVRVGKRQNKGAIRHFGEHFRLQDATGGQTEKKIGVGNDLAQRSRRRWLRVF